MQNETHSLTDEEPDVEMKQARDSNFDFGGGGGVEALDGELNHLLMDDDNEQNIWQNDESETEEREIEDFEGSYSQEETLTSIYNFFHFLTQFYLPESAIMTPPEGGWPTITPETMKHLGKSEEVISLLRHLPYIRNDSHYHCAPDCSWNNFEQYSRLPEYKRAEDQRVRFLAESHDLYRYVTPDVFGIGYGKKHFNWPMLLDTTYGVVYWLRLPFELRYNPEIEDKLIYNHEIYDTDEEDEWRNASTFTIKDFLKFLRIGFVNLNLYLLAKRSFRQ